MGLYLKLESYDGKRTSDLGTLGIVRRGPVKDGNIGDYKVQVNGRTVADITGYDRSRGAWELARLGLETCSEMLERARS